MVRGVVDTLNEGARTLDPAVTSRLYDIRREAVRRVSAQHVGGGVLAWSRDHIWAPVLLLALISLGAWHGLRTSQSPLPAETSNVDILLLTGTVPPQAFADWSLVSRDNAEAVCLTAH